MLHTSIETEAHWTMFGWHGGIYCWKLKLITTVATVWIPLAAELTPANVADDGTAPRPLSELLPHPHLLLGDSGYDAELCAPCPADARLLVNSQAGPYPYTDAGVEVRRIFHTLRWRAIENLNGKVKGIFDCGGQVPTSSLVATHRYVLSAVFVYQFTLLYRFEHGGDLRVGLNPFLKAA